MFELQLKRKYVERFHPKKHNNEDFILTDVATYKVLELPEEFKTE